jgi:hypothetical protein
VARRIFQARPVWIYTQSNITNIIFTWVHNTDTEKKLYNALLHYWDGCTYCIIEFLRSQVQLTFFLWLELFPWISPWRYSFNIIAHNCSITEGS